MRITVEAVPGTSLITQRTVNNTRRWYYAVASLPWLILVSHTAPLEKLAGQQTVLLFDTPDSRIAADVLGLPDEWREHRLIQATVKPVKNLPRGPAVPLGLALRQGYEKMQTESPA